MHVSLLAASRRQKTGPALKCVMTTRSNRMKFRLMGTMLEQINQNACNNKVAEWQASSTVFINFAHAERHQIFIKEGKCITFYIFITVIMCQIIQVGYIILIIITPATDPT